MNYDSILQRLSLFWFLNNAWYFLCLIFLQWLMCYLFDFFAVIFLCFFSDGCAMADGSIVWLYFAKMFPYDSFIWFCAMMFVLCLLRNDVFFSVYCEMIFYFSEILVCLQCGRPLQGAKDKKSHLTFFSPQNWGRNSQIH